MSTIKAVLLFIPTSEKLSLHFLPPVKFDIWCNAVYNSMEDMLLVSCDSTRPIASSKLQINNGAVLDSKLHFCQHCFMLQKQEWFWRHVYLFGQCTQVLMHYTCSYNTSYMLGIAEWLKGIIMTYIISILTLGTVLWDEVGLFFCAGSLPYAISVSETGVSETEGIHIKIEAQDNYGNRATDVIYFNWTT